MRREILFPKLRSRQTTRQHNLPIVILNWRCFSNKGQQHAAQIGGKLPIQADFGGNPNTATTAQVAAREEAAIGQHRQGTTSTDQNKQYDRGQRKGELLISAKWLCCILYALLCVFFFCFAFLVISHVIIPGIEGNENYP